MSKIAVFCENYTTIDTTLYLATRNGYDSPITIVIPANHDLFRFFQVISERVLHNTVKLIYFEAYGATRAKAKGIINKICQHFLDIIRERQYLKEIFNRHFAELEGCEVFFFSRGYSGVRFYLLKKLSKRNRLVYMSHARPSLAPLRKYHPTNIVGLVWLIRRKLIYGHEIGMGKYPHVKGLLYIPDRFMEKYVGRVIDWEEKNEMMKGFDLSQFKVFNVGNYSVIYFDQPLVEAGYVADGDTYRRELTEIFNILRKYFPEKEIARKYHPNFPGDKTMIKIGDVLPDFIPAELLYNENVKMYLGFFSFSLAHVEDGLAVSMIDLISLKNNKTRNELKEILMQTSHSEILFPKSLDEFEKILASVK